jgi:8-oxo-dGTP diphosphatase
MIRRTYIGVYGVAVNEGNILLTKKGATSCYCGLWDLPGGGVEFGESPEQTLRREFKEEVGRQFSSMVWLANLSHIVNHEVESLLFHHLGQIYWVKDCGVLPHQEAEDPHEWRAIEGLNLDTLTPFARQGLSAFLSFKN